MFIDCNGYNRSILITDIEKYNNIHHCGTVVMDTISRCVTIVIDSVLARVYG